MIVHINGVVDRGKNLPYLRKLVQIIHSHGAVIARNWLDAEESRLMIKSSKEKVDWVEVVEANLEAISRSDIVIIEATSYNFMQGYQAAVALQQRKPTLIISRDKLKEKSIIGIRNKFLVVKSYNTENELAKIANKFIKENRIATKDLRFNFFIDRQIYNYLRDISYETGKNKSEIIRELLDNEIKRRES